MYSFLKIPWQQARWQNVSDEVHLGKTQKKKMFLLSENEVKGVQGPVVGLVSANVPQAANKYECTATMEYKTKAACPLGAVVV